MHLSSQGQPAVGRHNRAAPGAESIPPGEPPVQPWPDLPCRVARASVAWHCFRGSWSPSPQRGLDNQEGKCGLCSLEGGTGWNALPCPREHSLQDVSASVSRGACPACRPSGLEKAALTPPHYHGPHFGCSLAGARHRLCHHPWARPVLAS